MSGEEHITRTFRIPKEYDEILKIEAKNMGQSVNSVMGAIIEKYVRNDRFYKDNQLLSVAPTTISKLLLMLNDDEVIKSGTLAGGTAARDNLLMRGMNLEFDSVKWFIEEILGKYAGWFTCNYHKMEGVHMFHLRHILDESWSLFIQAYLEEMVNNILELDVDASLSGNTVTLRIPVKATK